MMTVAQLAIEVNAPTQKAEENLKRTSGEVEKTGSAFGRLPGFVGGAINSLVSFAGQLTLAWQGAQQVIGVFSGWVTAAEQATQNQNLLNAVLKSTHDAVGMSADQINAMVQSLKSLTGVDDDVILQGTNMLLTFTNIGKNVFPQANQTMLDMAVAMNHGSLAGLDLKDTAIQLGKALNDPINGLSALSRVGVTFTQQQKDQIKALQDSGDMAGAQKIILNELAREFGGAAKAAGDADPFNRFKLAMGDIGKAIGGLLLPPLTALANFIAPLATGLLNWIGTLNQTGGAFSQLGDIWNKDILPPLQEIARIILVDAAPGFDAIKQAVMQLLGPFENLHVQLGPMQLLWNQINNAVWLGTQAFDTLASVLSRGIGDSFTETLKDWGPIIQNLSGWFQSQMLPAIQSLEPPLEALVGVLVTKGIPAFFAIRDAVSHVVAVMVSTLLPIFEKVEPIVVRLAGFLLDLGQKALAFLIPKVEDAVKAISKFADEMSTRLGPFINRLANDISVGAKIIEVVWTYLWPTMSAVLKYAWDIISGVVKTAWDLITGIFKIGADLLSGNWGQLWTDIQGLVTGVWGDIKNLFFGFLSDLGNVIATSPIGQFFDKFILEPVKGAVKAAIGWIEGLWQAFLDFISGKGQSINPTSSGNYGKGGSGARASGGPVFAGGAYTVGENRRETFVPQQDGYILNNKQTEQLLASAKGGHTFNINGANVNYPQQLMSLLQREAALHPV